MAKEKWMQDVNEETAAKGTKGKLRRRLHVKEGEKIPAKKLAKAARSKDPSLRKEANLAKVYKRAAKNRKKTSRANKR
jgi:hypothetical protein